MLATPRTVAFEGESVSEFLKGFRSDATKDNCTRKLRYFLGYVRVGPDEFLARTKQNPKWAEHMIIDYVEARRNQVSGSTISQVREALKHFYAMNDAENGVDWAKIVQMMPRAKKVGSDRAPTVEEVRRTVDSADLRLKSVILLLCSSGVRVGALELQGGSRSVEGMRKSTRPLRRRSVIPQPEGVQGEDGQPDCD